jgi:hypothetical protein
MATAVGVALPRGAARAALPALQPAARSAGLRLALGAGLLLGQWAFIFGAAWDVQWHIAVGRDRPFIPPHLLLLSGIALTGVLALAAAVCSTWAAWRGPAAPGATGVARKALQAPPDLARFLWIVRAPLGVYLAGFGALFSALAFPLDDYWHRRFGLDATLWSPFHVMIVSGMALAALGTSYVFASSIPAPAPSPPFGAPEKERWGRAARRSDAPDGGGLSGAGAGGRWLRLAAGLGGALSLATLAGVLLILTGQALDSDGILRRSPGAPPLLLYPPLLALATIPWLVAAAAFPGLAGGASVAALALMLMRSGLFAFGPWAVQAAAAAERVPVRPSVPPVAALPLAFPGWLIVSGLLIDAAWVLARLVQRRSPLSGRSFLAGRRIAVWLPLALAGPAAALVQARLDQPWLLTLPLTRAARGVNLQAAFMASLPAVAVCGLAGALLGIGLSAGLRHVQARDGGAPATFRPPPAAPGWTGMAWPAVQVALLVLLLALLALVVRLAAGPLLRIPVWTAWLIGLLPLWSLLGVILVRAWLAWRGTPPAR